MTTKTQPSKIKKAVSHRTPKEILSEDFIAQEEVCDRLQLSRFTILKMRKDGTLIGKMHGNRVFIRRDSLEAYERDFEAGLAEYRNR